MRFLKGKWVVLFAAACVLCLGTARTLLSDETGPAEVTLNDVLNPFASTWYSSEVQIPAPVKMTVNVAPNAWAGKPVEVRVFGEQNAAENPDISGKYFDGTHWTAYDDVTQVPVLKTIASLGPITDFAFTLLDSSANLSESSFQVDFCVSLAGTPFNPFDTQSSACGHAVYQLNGATVVSRPGTADAIRAGSVRLSTGPVFGAAEMRATAQSSVTASFDLTLAGNGAASGLYLMADSSDPAFPNSALTGVTVQVTSIENSGGYEGRYAVYANRNLSLSAMTMNASALQQPAQLQQAMSGWVSDTAGKTQLSHDEALALLQDPTAALLKTSQADLQNQMVANEMLMSQSFQAMNVPFPFVTDATAPAGFLVLRPNPTQLRVRVTAAPGTAPFRIFAGEVPFTTAPVSGGQLGVTWQHTRALRVLVLGQELLNSTLDAGTTHLKGNNPPPELPLPPFCKELTQTDAAKAWGNIASGAVNGGAVVSGVAFVGGPLLGAGAAAMGDASTGLGWATGVATSFGHWASIEQQLLTAYAVNAFLPFIDKIDCKVLNPDNFCLNPHTPQQHSDLQIECRYTNPCGKQLWGVASDDRKAYLTNIKPGDLSRKGPASGTEFYGTGDHYEFDAVSVGQTTMVVLVPLLDRVEKVEIPINVQKCASPQKSLSF